MPLTDTAVRAARPRQKAYKLSDERGLYLLVHPRGGRYWRLTGTGPNGPRNSSPLEVYRRTCLSPKRVSDETLPAS